MPSGPLGTRPWVTTVPQGAGERILNEVLIGNRTRLGVQREGPGGPIRVTGTVRIGRDRWRQLSARRPERYAASVLRSVLESRGIRVLGRVRSATPAEGAERSMRKLWAPAVETGSLRILARHVSPHLETYLEVVNKDSHNLLADQIFKTVGRIVVGDGSYAGGGRAVERFLADEVGVDTANIILEDGSGLSSLNRVAPSDFVSLLRYMAASPFWETFWGTLPEAGNARELARMHRTAAAGNLRAKTGTIQSVSALSGMVRAANGERIVFSILSNEVRSTRRAKRIEDLIGTRLALFERPLEATGDAGSGGESHDPP